MRVRSPDEILVTGTDRILALPQRAGVPLPAVLTLFPRALVGCAIAECVVLALRGHVWVLAFLLLPALLAIHAALLEAKAYEDDAWAWGRSSAERYRASALHFREAGCAVRTAYAAAAVMAGMCCVLAVANGLPGADGFVADAGLLAVGIGLIAARTFALCALPVPVAVARRGRD